MFKITVETITDELSIYTLLAMMETNYWVVIAVKASECKKTAIDYLKTKANEKVGNNIVERFTL